VLESYCLTGEFFRVKRGLAVDVDEKGLLYVLEGKPALVKVGDRIVPYVRVAPKGCIKRVYVDRGAVEPITRGADVMAPGIVRHDDFSAGDIVLVLIEGYDHPLAVGEALVDSSSLATMKKGKVIKNLHHLHDKFWKVAREFERTSR